MDRPDIVSQKEFDFVVSNCVVSGVDPYLIFAIGLHETGWGTKGWGKHGYILGVGCFNEKKADKRFKGFDAQINWAIREVSEFIGFRVTQKKIENFAKYVWKPASPGLWAAGVWRWYTRLINTDAPEMPICMEPPQWAVFAVLNLFNKRVINTPFGDLDFYRTCQVTYNILVMFTQKGTGEKDAKNRQ